MTETAAAVSEPPKAKSPKKKAGAKAASKPKPKTHPPTAQMVNTAIKSLKERGGSSLRAIKKYIAANYKVDAEKMAPFIRKYIKTAVASGKLTQTKGSGASGSFKLPGGDEGKKKVVKKPKAAAATKKPAAPKAKKSPSKAKKVKKPPTTPKAPKPKKTTAKSPAKPKKAPAKKAPAKKPAAKKASPKKK